MNFRLIAVIAGLLLVGGGLLGMKSAADRCRPVGSDEEQLRRMLIDGEAAAERHQGSGVTRFLSPDYQDSVGMSDTSLGFHIRRYLARVGPLEVTIPPESVRIQSSPTGRTPSSSSALRSGRRWAAQPQKAPQR